MGRKSAWGVGLVLFLTAVLAGSAGADWGPTEIQVSCYAGNRYDNQYLGTVDIFEAAKAAASCNMMYNDCKGSCSGCYTDENSRELCIDSSGTAYYF